MPKKPKIQLEQFIQKYATEFYLTEQKRKRFLARFIPTIVISSSISIIILITAFLIKNPTLAFISYLSIIPVLLTGLISSLYFWISFQENYKKLILEILVKEYFPQLAYNVNGLNHKHADLIEKTQYKKEYKKTAFRSEDLIYGPIGQLYIRLFEAKIDGYKNRANHPWKFKGIVLEIQNIPSAIDWTDLREDQNIQKAYNQIFNQHQVKKSSIFQSPNGNWYIFLKHYRENYLEPNKFKKSFNQEDLEVMIKDFYYFIYFAELLNDKIFIPNKRH